MMTSVLPKNQEAQSSADFCGGKWKVTYWGRVGIADTDEISKMNELERNDRLVRQYISSLFWRLVVILIKLDFSCI